MGYVAPFAARSQKYGEGGGGEGSARVVMWWRWSISLRVVGRAVQLLAMLAGGSPIFRRWLLVDVGCSVELFNFELSVFFMCVT